MAAVSAKKPADPNATKALAALTAARKSAAKTFFHKPNWTEACQHYAEAVKYYRMAGDAYVPEFVVALREGARANKEDGSLNTAAVNLEKAAQALKEAKDNVQATELFKDSANYYRANGQPDKAASMLVLAANTIEDVPQSLALFNDACLIFEEEKRGQFAEDTFTKAIIHALKYDRYAEALNLMERQNALFEAHMDTFESQLYRNYLQAMVVRFAQQDYKVAEEGFQAAESRQAGFAASEYYGCCLGLMAAYEAGSAEDLKNEVAKSPYKYLNNQVSRLAKKLVLSPALLAAAEEKARASRKAAPGEGLAASEGDDLGDLA